MPTTTTTTEARAAAIAARIRSLSDEALCALIDCARWADETGDLPEIAQSEDVYNAIGEVMAEMEDDLI